VSDPIERYCPRCGAEPGLRCIGSRGQERRAFHRGRCGRRVLHPIFGELKHTTESPIEKLLVGALLGWIDHHGAAASVKTQAPIGPFRADILVEEGGRSLIVECDGAAYHNSKESVERDRRRDRYCAINGIAVMRFSGNEINGDPRRCAAEIGMWITRR
jgi:very-short-patch-repair endonuclease